MNYTALALRQLGRDVGEIAEHKGITPTNPYKPGSWQHKAYGEGLSCGKQLAQLRPKPG